MQTPERQRKSLIFAGAIATGLLGYLLLEDGKKALLFAVGLAMGVCLLQASFGFTGAYRQLLRNRDMTGFAAQLFMLAAAVLLFAPILAQGSAFGHGVSGSLAPVSISVAFGAFMFGIGMQLVGGCASGTLYLAGSGNARTILALLFFCFGAFWGSLDLGWWQTLPSAGSISLSKTFGWELALPMQLGAIGLILAGLRLGGWKLSRDKLWFFEWSWDFLLRGPWPLLLSAGLLALLNWLTLLIAGHAWSITWAFSLWAAKGAVLFGWDPMTSSFWSGGFQKNALARSVLTDTTSVMNFGILLGAMLAAPSAGKCGKKLIIETRTIAAAVIGGILMGYGARLSYGCNIGAFFSGVASGSLHGWVWLLCALPGNAVGIALRKPFRLER